MSPRGPASFRSSVSGLTIDGQEISEHSNTDMPNSPIVARSTSDLGDGGVEPPPTWNPKVGWTFSQQKPDVVR